MTRRAAFALPELAAVGLVAALLACVMLPAASRSRRLANLGADIGRLHDLAQGTSLYSAVFKDQVWAFSWRGGVHYNTPWPDLNDAFDDLQAQSNQAVEILRRRAGRTDIPRIGGWIPNILYTHLVLADFLDAPLPWLTAVSSGDTDRLRWASDPACFTLGCFAPCQPTPAYGASARVAYSGSFQEVPAAWDLSPAGNHVEQGPANNLYSYYPQTHLGPARLSDVAHPADKVQVMDEFARHFGRETAFYFAHPQAKLPLLFFDGRAELEQTRRANPGGLPNQPASPQPSIVQAYIVYGTCEPHVGCQGTCGSTPQFPAPGVFRWTRCGLAGRDFGEEVWCGADQAAAAPSSRETRSP